MHVMRMYHRRRRIQDGRNGRFVIARSNDSSLTAIVARMTIVIMDALLKKFVLLALDLLLIDFWVYLELFASIGGGFIDGVEVSERAFRGGGKSCAGLRVIMASSRHPGCGLALSC
jgi:hypothetical protein